MDSRYYRPTIPARQRVNALKLARARELVGRRFNDRGVVRAVRGVNEQTGDCMVSMYSRGRMRPTPFDPFEVEKNLID